MFRGKLRTLNIFLFSLFILFASSKSDDDWEKEVVSLLDKIKTFGEKWKSTAEEKWKDQFGEDWNSEVIQNVDKIKEIASQLKETVGNDVNKEFVKNWKPKVQVFLDKIHQFGGDWKPRVGKKLRGKFSSDWKEYVERTLDSIREFRDYWKKKAQEGKKYVSDKISQAKEQALDKVNQVKDIFSDLIKGIPDWKKLKEQQSNMDSNFPLPFDLEGVKVKYHRQKICVKDGGEERCVTKNDVPSKTSSLQNIFRVVVEYEILANQNKYTDDDNDISYSSEYKHDGSSGEAGDGDGDESDGDDADHGKKVLKKKKAKPKGGRWKKTKMEKKD